MKTMVLHERLGENAALATCLYLGTGGNGRVGGGPGLGGKSEGLL